MKYPLLVIFFLFLLGSIFYATKKYPVLVSYQNRSEVNLIENIAYINDTNPKHKLDIYLPTNTTNFPVVHFIHGGYWSSGDKNYYAFGTGLYKNIGYTLAKNGIGVVIQNYRLYPEVKIDDLLSDAGKGVQWTVNNIQNYGGDKNKIYLMGHSAGGHMVSLLGTDPTYLNAEKITQEQIKGVIALSPVWDINDMVANKDNQFNEELSYPLFGKDEERYKKFSPKTYMNENMQKMFVIIGENDFPYIIKQVNTIVPTLTTKPKFSVIPGYIHMNLVTQIGKTNDQVTPLLLEFIQK